MALSLFVTSAFGQYRVGDAIGDATAVANALINNASSVIGKAIGGAAPTSAPFTTGEAMFYFGSGTPSGGLGGANCTYVNTLNNHLWVNNAGTWQDSGALLEGPVNFTMPPIEPPLYLVAMSYAASLALDGSKGRHFKVTLTGNTALAAPTNMQVGVTYYLELVQDATGSRTMSYSAPWKFAGGSATLSTAANAVDLISLVYDGTNVFATLNKAFA